MEYVYDAASRITSRTTGGVTTTYTYDWRDQLLSETRPGYAASYTYDHNGNRLSRTINGVTEDYLYSDEDQLLEVVGGTDPRTFAYDKQGRTILIDRAGKVNDQEFTYDQESRITSVTRNGQTVNYAYNGLDTRTSVTMGSTVNTFLRDGAYVTDPVLVDSGATYTPGISERRGTTTTYLHSGLKNAFAQSGAAQTLAAVREYDAFGNVTSGTGAWAGPFGYAGKFGYQSPSIPGTSTPDEGLKLLGHRYYDPSTGRFLTRDPIFDGRNWYSYGGGEGNPLSFTDPTGLITISFGAEGGFAAILGIEGQASFDFDLTTGNFGWSLGPSVSLGPSAAIGGSLFIGGNSGNVPDPGTREEKHKKGVKLDLQGGVGGSAGFSGTVGPDGKTGSEWEFTKKLGAQAELSAASYYSYEWSGGFINVYQLLERVWQRITNIFN